MYHNNNDNNNDTSIYIDIVLNLAAHFIALLLWPHKVARPAFYKAEALRILFERELVHFIWDYYCEEARIRKRMRERERTIRRRPRPMQPGCSSFIFFLSLCHEK